MRILQITPGAGGMYCGNCFRDNTLVAALRKLGHDAVFVPMYLPMRLDEEDQSAGAPIFFGGINVYLEQKSLIFRKAPGWLRGLLSSPGLLKLAANKAAKTRAADVGEMTISMLRGEEGNQARDLEEMITWFRSQPPLDVICLSNALMVGMARRMKPELHAPVVCYLQGEDAFLDSFPDKFRKPTWQLLAERCRDVDLFVAPSQYFADVMSRHLSLPSNKMKVVYNGINFEGYSPASAPPTPPVIGYFARMCREKGLDTLVQAYILLRKRDRIKDVKLHIGGGCGPSDQPFVAELRKSLSAAGVLEDVQFFPNLERGPKQEFLRNLSVFSVPALYGEAFGLYIIEALASGIPVVQPEVAAFPELIAATGGGRLCAPGNAAALADALEQMLLDPKTAQNLGQKGRQAVLERFTNEHMARQIAQICGILIAAKPAR
ncbi:MAG TPA: glycosyltransferase family 4 protein [Candidatus Binatia bacterium]|nr:glycosyltransferase family 4 protein [Candidatus Binatia bacterium]